MNSHISGGPKAYWASMTKAERRAEMQRRMAVRRGITPTQKFLKASAMDAEEIVNQVMHHPDTFLTSIDAAIQSQTNRIAGLKGEIEQAERIIGRLENFRDSLEFADNRKLPGRSSGHDLDIPGEVH